MVRVGDFAGRNPQDFDREGMPLSRVGGLRIPAQTFGNLFARARKFPFRRSPGILLNRVGVNLLHWPFSWEKWNRFAQ
jgi:hypothetical protein